MGKKLIRFDWAIKKLLRNKANFGVLEGFLSELLSDDIKIHKILESEGNQENVADKFNRVDMLVENAQGELLIIEVQNQRELDYFHRVLYGTSKLITEYLELGEPYALIKKIISISIIHFDLGQGEDYVYRGCTNYYGIHKNDLLGLSETQKLAFKKSAVESIYPEYYLIRANNFDDVARNTLDEWIYFLKHARIESNFTAKGLKEASQVLDRMQLSQAEQKTYQRYMENLSYHASVFATARFEGQWEVEKLMEEEKQRAELQLEEERQRAESQLEEERKRAESQLEEERKRAESQLEEEKKQAGLRLKEIAKSLLANQVPMEIIMQSTGLSREEIEELGDTTF
ncbi:MAG: hypothetical protein HC880_03585 [Bacteroidia bacterium]|nr:hypothetical protein [Bacteroidia bacterium]